MKRKPPYRYLVPLALSVFCTLAAAQERPRADSLAIIERLRSENVRLRFRVRSLEAELDSRNKAGSSTGISSLDDSPADNGTGDAFYSLADKWDALTVDNDTPCLASDTRGGNPSDGASAGSPDETDALFRVPHDDVYRKYLDIYSIQRRNAMVRILGRYDGYRDMFLSVFRKYGIPDEVTCLCIIESAVTTRAISPAGAAGLWQLMPDTARRYGLEVALLNDERFDPLKSTEAAARFLSDRFAEFGDWCIVLMSYNCGAARMRRVVGECGGDLSYENVVKRVPQETQDYLPAFAAALHVARNRSVLYED